MFELHQHKEVMFLLLLFIFFSYSDLHVPWKFGCLGVPVFFSFFFICGLWLISKKERRQKDLEEEPGIVRQQLGALEWLTCVGEFFSN